MLKALLQRARQGHRTIDFPGTEPVLPDRFRGRPIIDATRCPDACKECVQACPTDAISGSAGSLKIDLGRCLFCTDCVEACPEGAITHSQDYRLAVRHRDELTTAGEPLALAKPLEERMRRLFGRSLKLRQVSAGGCGACEADANVLSTVVFDMGRFGIQFVASPRHADGLLVTGAVSRNMSLALKKTYDAIPSPKLVIAVGACAISGGPYVDHPEVLNGAANVLPVDLFVPGCPPHPLTLLDGLLRLLGRLEDARQGTT
jgi:Ni,Fe-hydrogenase III small subunit/NAD-dependent dihydropyrimidine dehydrogenase PreA subunit